ncbi:MAG: PxxKW family cysteine-rich protein [Desulfopila sp.]|jgi:hypothetical protein|nr:PxxKW family cysteine-rich protein [Desulfopila sp.]
MLAGCNSGSVIQVTRYIQEDNMQEQAAVQYSQGKFQPVIDKCEGCERIVEENGTKYCQTYLFPEAKWRLGICNFATHRKPEIVVATVKVNPLKAAKRASKSKK